MTTKTNVRSDSAAYNNQGQRWDDVIDPALSAADSTATSTVISPPGGVRNESAAARRLAEREKLLPYQRTAVDEFTQSSQIARDIRIFVSLCALDNKLNSLITAIPPFSILPPLHESVKSFIIAVLLSPKLAAYTGNVPRDHVMALIMRDRLHLPPSFNRDPYAMKVLKEEVNHELAQACSKLKKVLKTSEKAGKNVFEIASALVSGTTCTVTVPLCGRVALFRKVYTVNSGEEFWKNVDKKLSTIRTSAREDPLRLARYFSAILKADQDKYPGDETAVIDIPSTTTTGDSWQVGVDNLIDGIV